MSRRRSMAVIASASLAVCLATGRPASAAASARDPRPVVAILGMGEAFPEEAWSEAEQASCAEFLASQMDVWFLPSQAEGPIERAREMIRVGEELETRCVLRISRDGPGSARAALLVRDAQSGASLDRAFELDGLTHPRTAAVAALRILEGCRSGWDSMHLSRETRRSSKAAGSPGAFPPAALGEELSALRQPRRPWTLAMGGALAASPGSGLAIGAVELSLGWALRPWWSLSTDTSLSVVGRSVGNEAGRASLHLASGRLFTAFTPRLSPRVQLALGPGAGLVFAWSRGAKSQGYLAQEDDALLAFVGVRCEVIWQLTEGWSFRWGLTGGFLAPQVRVAFGDEQVAGFGRPLVETGLRFGFSFPQRSRGEFFKKKTGDAAASSTQEIGEGKSVQLIGMRLPWRGAEPDSKGEGRLAGRESVPLNLAFK